MNEKQAREIVSLVDKNEEACGRFNNLAELGSRYWIAKGYLECLEQVRPLVEARRQQVQWFEAIKKKQHALLIEGQDLDSASKNWEEATTLDSPLDFEPVITALSQWDEIQNIPEENRRMGCNHPGPICEA